MPIHCDYCERETDKLFDHGDRKWCADCIEVERVEKTLLPCPFCGHKTLILQWIAPHKHYIVDLPDYGGAAFIECPNCTAALSAKTIQGAGDRWNRREANANVS